MVRGGPTMHVALQRNVSRVHLVHLSGFTTYRIKVGLMKNGDATFWSEEVLASGLQGGKKNTLSVSLQDEEHFGFAIAFSLL